MRDTNRSLVYDVEDRLTTAIDNGAPLRFYGSVLQIEPDRKFADIPAVQRYVDLLRELDWGHGDTPRPGVVAARGTGRATWSAPATIRLPDTRWAMREVIVLHEYAHHAVFHVHGATGHTPMFCRVYTELVRNAVGPAAATLLLAGFDQAGVYSPT